MAGLGGSSGWLGCRMCTALDGPPVPGCGFSGSGFTGPGLPGSAVPDPAGDGGTPGSAGSSGPVLR